MVNLGQVPNLWQYLGGTINLRYHLIAKHSLSYVSTVSGITSSQSKSQVKLDLIL